MSEQKVSQTVEIVNPEGLHLRAASLFVQVVKDCDAEIEVVKNDLRANGKSIFELMSLGAQQGVQLVLEATGPDAKAAVKALAELIEQGFHKGDQDSQPGNESLNGKGIG